MGSGSGWFSVPGSAASAASGGLGLIGGLLSGFSEAGQANARAAIARNNAIISRQNAATAAQAGEANAEKLGLRERGRVADISARQAGAGIDPNSGSALDVRQSAAMLGNLDVLTQRSQAARQAYGYQLEAAQHDLEQAMARKQAKMAPWLGLLGGAGSLISSASSLSGNYKQWQMEHGNDSEEPAASQAGSDSALGDYETMFT